MQADLDKHARVSHTLEVVCSGRTWNYGKLFRKFLMLLKYLLLPF